jgi:LPS O-antigen subunit length determinant protein (WzzB/FepE family)
MFYKKIFLFYFLFLSPLLSISSLTEAYHPIHLSVTDVEYNQKDKSLEIIYKVFIDDFEKILETNYKTRLYLATEKENPETDKFVIDYLKKNFQLEIDGKRYIPDFHGKFTNTKEDIFAIWILAKVENISQIKNIKLSNTMLMDLYDDQDNFVHFKYLGQRKSMRFKDEARIDEISF